jgi:hypothetical protein
MTTRLIILQCLLIISLAFEYTYGISKFLLIHSIVCAILLKDVVQSIDWDEVMTTFHKVRHRIEYQFIYS